MAGFVGGDIMAADVSAAFSAKYFISKECRTDEVPTPETVETSEVELGWPEAAEATEAAPPLAWELSVDKLCCVRWRFDGAPAVGSDGVGTVLLREGEIQGGRRRR